MNAKDAIGEVIEMGHFLARHYVEDLADADLLVRPVPGANHIAWQLGHLVAATARMLSDLGQPAPPLPDGFASAYTKETAALDEASRFATKDQYLAWMDQMKAASLAAVDAVPESKLDAPGPESMRHYAPTVGSVLLLLGTHWLMHAGQFVPVRRKLGRPALF
mgnify:CR=1 FL=1